MITLLPRVPIPGRALLLRLSPAQVLRGRIAIGHIDPANPNPGVLKAANHFGQNLLDLTPSVRPVHLEHPVQVFSLFSKPH